MADQDRDKSVVFKKDLFISINGGCLRQNVLCWLNVKAPLERLCRYEGPVRGGRPEAKSKCSMVLKTGSLSLPMKVKSCPKHRRTHDTAETWCGQRVFPSSDKSETQISHMRTLPSSVFSIILSRTSLQKGEEVHVKSAYQYQKSNYTLPPGVQTQLLQKRECISYLKFHSLHGDYRK